MSARARHPSTPAADQQTGLSADELRAEQAGDLPDREAMSILDVGGLPVGLPTPGDVDGVLDGADPLDGQPALGVVDPIDGSGQTPIGDLPTHLPPVDTQPGVPPIGTHPVDTLPVDRLPVIGDPPDIGGLISIPEQPVISIDTDTTA